MDALGTADGSVAWLIGIASVGQWVIGTLSDAAQQEVFAADPDIRIAGNLEPVPAEAVGGGLYVARHRPISSASGNPLWVMIAASSRTAVSTQLCLVPVSASRSDAVGSGTDSATVTTLSDASASVFVPTYRTRSFSSLLDGASPETHREVYGLPFQLATGALLLGALLGISAGALASATEVTGQRPAIRLSFMPNKNAPDAQRQIADAALMLGTARMHAYRITEELDQAVVGGTTIGLSDRNWIRAECLRAARRLLEVIAVLAAALKRVSAEGYMRVLQCWRDANTATQYALLDRVRSDGITGLKLTDLRELSTAGG